MSSDVWDPGSRIVLCSVPWDSEYQDAVKFPNESARDVYFNSLDSASFENSSYMPLNQPVCVALPYSSAYKYNYCFIDNSKLPTENEFNNKIYYYFITETEYVNPSTTRLYLQLDVFTTYQFDFTFGIGYCERGHVAMCNEPSLTGSVVESMRNYLDDDEGLNVGSEMINYRTDVYSLQTGDVSDYVSIVSTADLTQPFGTIDSPSLHTAAGGYVGGIFSGCDVYFVEKSHFKDVMTLLQDYSWVAQCIISITVIPSAMLRDVDLNNTVYLNGSAPDFSFIKPSFSNNTIPFDIGTIDINNIKNGLNNDSKIARYSDIRKLWTYPYNVIEVSCFNGNSIFLKPQLLRTDVTKLFMIYCSIMPFVTACVYPQGYCSDDSKNGYTISYDNASGDNLTRYVENGDFIDTALWLNDFPQFSIVSNSYIAYMASTANTRAYSYDSAAWALDASNAASYNSAINNSIGYGVSLTNQLNSNDTSMNIANRNNNFSNRWALVDGAVGAATSAASGNMIGVGTSALGSVRGFDAASVAMQNATDSLATSSNNAIRSYNASMDINKRNYDLSNYISNGNYENTVRGIDAGYRDAALKPPSQIGQMGGEGFKYANGLLFSIVVRYKRITDDHICKIGDYFRKYGYYVKRFITVTDLQLCKYFTYWKFTDISIISSYMNETEKNTIRGIFCKGVTVWSDPAKIGTVAPSLNTPEVIKYFY